MGKIKFIVTRLLDMNYRQMVEKINAVHVKSGKNRLFIFLDMAWCALAYQAGYMDYWIFEMYNMTREQRKTILTRGKSNALVKKYNDPRYNKQIENKLNFARNFSEFMHREWLDMTTATREDFDAFTKKHPVFMAKPVGGMCGRGIEKIEVDRFDGDLYEHLTGETVFILEECVRQHEKLMELHPYSVNTCRVVSFTRGSTTKIVTACLRIGNGKFVDNFANGGMVVPIEVDRGEVIFPAMNEKGEVFEKHPLTGVAIKGFKLPMWNEALELVKKAGQVVPQVGLVGWDVCITDNGPLLIEGNDFPAHDLYQLPPHRKDGKGILPVFMSVIESVESSESI